MRQIKIQWLAFSCFYTFRLQFCLRILCLNLFNVLLLHELRGLAPFERNGPIDERLSF